MGTDILILIMYGIAVLIAKPGNRTSPVAVFMWFLASFLIAVQGWTALPTFSLYWSLAALLTMFLATRGSLIMVWASGSMLLLQTGMVADALVTSRDTPLYNIYTELSLVINLFIIITTYIHGQGIGSVNNSHNPADRGNKQHS